MKQITIDLYTIDELKNINEKAYNKIIEEEKEYYINTRFEFAQEDTKNLLERKYNLFIKESNIYYSISYCQGDGACFTDNDILSYTRITTKKDMNAFEKWIVDNLSNDELKLLIEYLNDGYNLNIIKDNYNYCHCYTCIIDYEVFYSSDDPNYVDNMNDFIYKLTKKLFDEVYINICNDIEKYLYSFYNVEDETIINDIRDRDCYYTASGEWHS